MAFMVYPTRYGTSTNLARYSADGINWAYATLPWSTQPGNNNMFGVGNINGIFIVSKNGTTTGAYSGPDPTVGTWTGVTLPVGAVGGSCPCVFNNKLYHTGGSTWAWTTDGANWTTGSLPNASGGSVITNGYLMISTNGTLTSYSSNGTDWYVGAAFPTSTWFGMVRALMWNGTYFIIANSSQTAYYYSTNAQSWSTGATFNISTQYGSDANPNSGRIVTVRGNTNTCVYSDNLGTSWTNATLPSSKLWRQVMYDTSLKLFCTFAYKTLDTATSPDGITWTARTGVSNGNENAMMDGFRSFVTYNPSQMFNIF